MCRSLLNLWQRLLLPIWQRLHLSIYSSPSTEANCRAGILPPSEYRVNMPSPETGPGATFPHSNHSSPNSWLSQKVRMCAQAIGVSVDNVKEGGDTLIAFANERDMPYKSVSRRKGLKRKGGRELQSLTCSINYDDQPSQNSSSLNAANRVRDFVNSHQ
ncbi:hypothetical protein AAC387_Pa04g1906 [Persea americana]